MATVRSPIFTTLYDKLGNSEFRRRRNKKIELAKKRIPSNPRTFKQRVIRKIYGQCVQKYNQLTDEEKSYYAQKYRKENLDAYRAFMKECLNQNKPTAIYEITIDNSQNPNELTDFQVLLNIENDTQFFEDIDYNPYAFYFMDEDLTKKIPFYREYFNPTTETTRIWLKVPSIPANGKVKLYMLINPNRTIDESNPNNVFDFFDDFEGTELDMNKWVAYNTGGSYEVKDSMIRVTDYVITTKQYQITDGVIEAKVKITAKEGSIFARASCNDCDAFANSIGLHSGDFGDGNDWNFAITVDNGKVCADTTRALINEWLLLRLILKGNTAISERFRYADMTRNANRLECTISKHTVGYIGLRTNGDNDRTAYYDWVRVRKFASPEPTVTYTRL